MHFVIKIYFSDNKKKRKKKIGKKELNLKYGEKK